VPDGVRRFHRMNAVAGAVAHFQRAMMVDVNQANATRQRPRRDRLSRCSQYQVLVVPYAAPAVRGWPSAPGSGAIASEGRNRQAGAAPCSGPRVRYRKGLAAASRQIWPANQVTARLGRQAMRDEEMLAQIEDFPRRLRSADLSRHEDQWGPRGYVVKPAWLERAMRLISVLGMA